MFRIVLLSLAVSVLANGFAVTMQAQSGLRLGATGPQMLFDSLFSKKSRGPSIPSNKKIVVITGTTSGLGKETVRALLKKDKYFVIAANRDVEKMKQVAERENFDISNLAIVELDLASFDSTKKFASKLNTIKGARPLDCLVCNAAVYQPALPTVT